MDDPAGSEYDYVVKWDCGICMNLDPQGLPSRIPPRFSPSSITRSRFVLPARSFPYDLLHLPEILV